jgi:crotonobetainyl-CoA:carnitine CoA-transferase CaiB-like acyl-CoA transferase
VNPELDNGRFARQRDRRRTALLPETTTVVEIGESVPTAVCGRYLERLGARVTRVLPGDAPPVLDCLPPQIGGGDQTRSAVAEWLRHGKSLRDISLDDAEGRAELDDLVRSADVVLIAGTTAEWASRGLSLEHVRTVASGAVTGQITPWGDEGARSTLRGGELLAQAAGGLMNLVGRSDREPVRMGGHPMQSAAGLLALDGVMIGLFHRQNTGQGSFFATSEFESTAHVEWKIASAVQSGRARERRGDEGGGPVVVQTRDGHFGFFFVPRNWSAVKAIVGDPRLDDERFSTPAGRAANATEYEAIMAKALGSMSKKDLYHRAQELNIPAGYVATMTDLLESPQYRSRAFFETIEIPGVGVGEIPDAPWQVFTHDDPALEGAPV